MSFTVLTQNEDVAIVSLSRGKVNALNELVVGELHERLKGIEADDTIRAVILTGEGRFFSFGFDIPEFLSYSKEAFAEYLRKFTRLYTTLFLFPKPVIAALNGHTVAGGCMLATACDYRIMVSGKAKIALNELNFGSSVFAGSAAMLRYCAGARNAEEILYSGTMYTAEDAKRLGIVDRIVSEESLPAEALQVARDYAKKDPVAFRSIKRLLRGPVAEEMVKSEEASIREFVDIWYSESTWKNLQQIKTGS